MLNFSINKNTLLRLAMNSVGILLLGACATGPMTDQLTARTLPEGEWVTGMGVRAGIPLVHTYTQYGATDHLELGITVEYSAEVLGGVNAKYSFFQPEQDQPGWALSGITGVGMGRSSDYYAHLGAASSYRSGNIEAGFFLRWNYVKADEVFDPLIILPNSSLTDPNDDYFNGPFSYIYLNPVLTWWLTSTRGLSLGVGLVLGTGGVSLFNDSTTLVNNYGLAYQWGW